MAVHILIFAVTAAVFAGIRLRFLKGEIFRNRKALRLFILVVLAGNLLGLFLTLQESGREDFPSGLRFRKQESSRQEELMVAVDGEEPRRVYVRVPAKEKPEEEEYKEIKLPEKEQKEREVEEALGSYNEGREDEEYYYLPEAWEGRTYSWGRRPDHSGTLLAVLFLAAGGVLWLFCLRESQNEILKRQEQMIRDYPSLLMKFTLLLEAGMTTRKAFRKIALDYQKRPRSERRYAYEAVAAVCHELDSGVPEAQAYRHFGEKCQTVQYRTFCTLLTQNLQKGSRHLVELLERESVQAWEERKRKARVMGELASTRLLFPMILMLMVVMAVIMVPAFLSFYG